MRADTRKHLRQPNLYQDTDFFIAHVIPSLPLPSQSPETTTDLLPVTTDLAVLELLIHGIKQYVLSLCLVYVTGKMSVRLIYATPPQVLAVSLGFLAQWALGDHRAKGTSVIFS